MNKSDINDLLHRVEIFKNIPHNLLENISASAETISHNSGEVIIRKGDDGDSMYVIAEGKVKIHDDEHIIAILEEGNFFGEFSLLDAAPRSMSVTAINDVQVISISRNLFYGLLQSQPEIAQKIIATLTNRLRRQNESIISQLKTREAELSTLVDERTKELKIRNEEITIKNKEITDNVNYAKRIQAAILPDIKVIHQKLPESFVIYLPKDIVSGDFFSFFPLENKLIILAADCTGHGVTGAFLSVIGNSLINQIINEKKVQETGKILDHLHSEFISVLNQRNNESTDGMDIAICRIDIIKKTLQFSGANRPLWLIRNGEIIILRPNKFPVGGLQISHDSIFNSHDVEIIVNDTIYIFTDGFADQFGGENGKKLMTKKFKEILLSIQNLSMADQRSYIKDFFDSWKGINEQVDDVLVIGIKIT